MSTISERANAYAQQETLNAEDGKFTKRTIVEAYEEGARAARAELTTWHHPKEMVPSNNREVLLKHQTVDGAKVVYTIGKYHHRDGWSWMCEDCVERTEMVGWRSINDEAPSRITDSDATDPIPEKL